MSKTLKYARNGAIAGGIGFLLLNLIKQLVKINEDPKSKFDWEDFLLSGGKGALIGGGTGLVAGGITDINNSLEKPLNTSSILNIAISEMTLNKQDHSYQLLSTKAEDITNLINVNFKEKLGGSIVRIGSTEENTALADDFDIDISVPFAPKSFTSTEAMYDELFYFLKDNLKDNNLIEVRAQRKSIGLLFNLAGNELKIDVVPYKLTPKKGNKTSGYLFVNNDSFFKNDSYTKTDIASLKEVKLTPTQQKIHVGIKAWKKNYNIPISSHLVKHLILDAYKANEGKIPRDFTKKLLMVVLHIRNEINFKRIVSVENTNNVLTDIDDSKKHQITKSCDEVLDEYEYQPNTVIEYFT